MRHGTESCAIEEEYVSFSLLLRHVLAAAMSLCIHVWMIFRSREVASKARKVAEVCYSVHGDLGGVVA